MVSLQIDFVSHPKIPVLLQSETSETGGAVSLFREKKFRYVSLQFHFEAKFGDTLVLSSTLVKDSGCNLCVPLIGLCYLCILFQINTYGYIIVRV